jgi:putative tryptophan/tyrosine transport system substrate-binding protein
VKRRDFMALVGAAATWPLAARAQDSSPVIGYLSSRSEQSDAPFVAGFRRGLAESGGNVEKRASIEFRWGDNESGRVGTLAAELVAIRPAVILAGGGSMTTLAVKRLTNTIPIVFVNGADPIRIGLVSSINRPEANLTGVNFLATQIVAKRLELLLNFVPKAKLIAGIVNPNNPDMASMARDFEVAPHQLGVQFKVFQASNMAEIDAAFAEMEGRRPDALLIVGDAYFNGVRRYLIAQCTRLSLPAIFDVREFAVEGGLMSYGTSQTDAYRQAGLYVGRILRGAGPADLPVLQSTRFELVINIATAKAFGIAVPDKLMALADEVIE